MLIYQKYKINPVSGCLLAFIQLPLLLAFYEAIQRTPAIFEDKFLFFELGKTPWTAIKSGEYVYIILVILIFVATLFSFRKTLKDQSANPAMNMKTTLYFMLAIITYSSFTIASAVGIYWVTSNVFTIIQNLLVERKKENGNWEEALPAIFVYDSQWRLIKDRDKLKEQVKESKNNGEIGCIIEANRSYNLKWPIMEFMEDDGPTIFYRFIYKLRRSPCGDSVRLYSNPFKVLPQKQADRF